MSLPIDAAPPGHLPRAATPPWPIQPPPHGAASGTLPVRPREQPGIGPLGKSLIGGAIAAIALAIALPLLMRRGAAKPAPATRRPRRRKTKAKA